MVKHHKKGPPGKKVVLGRRIFVVLLAVGIVCFVLLLSVKSIVLRKRFSAKPYKRKSQKKSSVYMLKGGNAKENMRKLVARLGGIESLIGPNDIVIIKPNAQWWRQGMTNTDSIMALIEMIVTMPSFGGEVIVADNHQFQEDDILGWTTDEPNGTHNLNGLIGWFNQKGHKNVTKYHWHCAGPNPDPLQADGYGDAVVSGPGQGDGYVWEKDNYYVADNGQKCLMTYPIFTSSYSGVTIDLKKGAWKNGAYTGQPIKFINISSLNHHGLYAGVTAAVKNLMGVVDMSCGYPAPNPADTYNTHHIGIKSHLFARMHQWTSMSYRLHGKLGKAFDYLLNEGEYINFHFTGGVLGHWIKTVRKPDLNIVTADWVGNGGRVNLEKATKPRALVASVDAVAADYIAAKYILLPETKKVLPGMYHCQLHDPDNKDGPFYKFLAYTAMETDGALDEDHIALIT